MRKRGERLVALGIVSIVASLFLFLYYVSIHGLVSHPMVVIALALYIVSSVGLLWAGVGLFRAADDYDDLRRDVLALSRKVIEIVELEEDNDEV